MVSCAVFGTRKALGSIEPILVFTALSLFNTLRAPFTPNYPRVFVMSLVHCAMGSVQDLLLEPECLWTRERVRTRERIMSLPCRTTTTINYWCEPTWRWIPSTANNNNIGKSDGNQSHIVRTEFVDPVLSSTAVVGVLLLQILLKVANR
jgi:hypothetical protein